MVADDEPDKYLNVRLPGRLVRMIEDAVSAANLNRSAWVREALEAAAYREMHIATRVDPPPGAPHPDSGPGGGFRYGQRCVHPLTARVRTPRFEACGLCGRKMTWLA